MKKVILFSSVLAMIFTLSSCEKMAGPGGSSVIRGHVEGSNQHQGKNEIIEITVTRGIELEHGDYFILNQANGNNYYFWFNNPTWVSDGDPHLTGRTGVAISFNYNDADTTIAQKVDAAINSVLNEAYTVVRKGDMVILSANTNAEIPDPDDVTTSFLMDVAQQGQSDDLEASSIIADDRVYLIYGDGEYYNESTRTGGDGEFQFENLQIGKYKVYVISKDSITGNMTEKIEQSIEITQDGSIQELNTFNILY
jgi:hypothetical protein